jgi:large subunit ribosomal protein L13
MRTYSPKPQDIERRWYVIDATGAVLGRLASQVASILRGKHKPIFAPHMDTGDHVIVVNARGVRLTGEKEAKKFYYRHSGYPGGLTVTQYAKLLSDRPELAVEKAIKGMLPKNRLGRAMAKKLQVYAGPEHPHAAQKPQPLSLGEVPPWTGLPERAPAREPTAAPAGRTGARKPVASRSVARGAAKQGGARKAAGKAAAGKPATTKAAAAARRAKEEA